MSLLPTPNPMSLVSCGGKILPIIGPYGSRRRQQYHNHQLLNQPYLLLTPNRSLYPNYYLVYVPLIGSPSTLATHMVASAMSTSVFQASALLNSLLTATSLLNVPSHSNTLLQKFGSTPSTSSSSSSIAFKREQYRYNMRPSYRYVHSHNQTHTYIFPLSLSLPHSVFMCVFTLSNPGGHFIVQFYHHTKFH